MRSKDFSIDGSLVIITGGNTGIGKEAARKLSSSGAKVIIACRNMVRAEEAAREITMLSQNPVGYMLLDLSDLSSIRTFSDKFLEVYGTPDVLINNAAVYMRKYRETGFGMESTMAVNYLAPFYLSNIFLPHMAALDGETRVINVTSDSYHIGDFDPRLEGRKHNKGFSAYSQSKRALMYFTFELADRIKKTAVTVNCLNPGHAATNIWPSDALHWKAVRGIIKIVADPPSYAAENVVFAAKGDELKGISGKYISNLVITEARKDIFKKDISLRLWEDTLDYLQKLI